MSYKDQLSTSESSTVRLQLCADRGWFWPKAHLILIAVYFLALFPLMFSEARYHGDELFYTDGAIGMIETGDYVTPHYSSGEERFRKPVLTYWIIAASYHIFGISLFASRIPFLLAGCLVILLSYKISLGLLQREEEALAASVVMFSNIQLFTLATRSTPDILQCCFLMTSLYGFSQIIFHRSKTVLNYSFAYFGSALAIATKGLLGIFPVLFAFALSLLCRRNLAKPKDLFSPKIMLLAAGFALLWFVLVFIEHGTSAISGFLGDQVTERLSGSKFYVLENIFAYVWALIRHFIPWSVLILLVLPKEKGTIRTWFREHKNASIFIVGWYTILFLIFMWSNIKRTRYLFPTYPLLAVLYSALLIAVMQNRTRADLIRTVEKILLQAGLIGSVLLATVGIFMDVRIIVGGFLLFLLTLFLYLKLFRKSDMGALIATGTFLVLLFSIYSIFVRPVFSVSPARSLATCIEPLAKKSPIEVGSIELPRDYLHQLLLFSGGKVWVRRLSTNISIEQVKKYPAVIVAEPYNEKMRNAGYRVQQCGYEYEKWKPKDILEYMAASDKPQFLRNRERFFYIAYPE